jgi:3-oxoacyl-[acyl-carrier-protein] synthase-3
MTDRLSDPRAEGQPRVAITGSGSFLPEQVLTNADLEKMVDTTDEWIVTRTGIRERRIASDGTVTSDLASAAGRRALESAGVPPGEVDLILVATITPDRPFPATACIVQEKLGATRAAAMDIAAACSGHIFGLQLAKSLVVSGTHANVLLISADILSRIIDWEDRSTCVLLGDGAGASVIQADPERGHEIVDTFVASDGSAADILQLPAGGSAIPPSHESIQQRLHYLKMEGNKLVKIATRRMVEALVTIGERNHVTPDRIARLVPHQANVRILETTARLWGFPTERVFLNLERYGNMSAASIAVALDEVGPELAPGDLVALVAFGSGLTWGSGLLRW